MEDSTTEITRASVEKKIDSFVDGDLAHATETLSALWEIVNKDGDIKAPSNNPPSVSLFRSRSLSGLTRQYLLHMISLRRSRAPPTGPL